jgi:hypothetical protein
MWFNFKTNACDPPDLLSKVRGAQCFVNGDEILQVWYANTDTGEVKTYDVLRDGRPHRSSEVLRLLPNARELGLDCPDDGVASKALHGSVELRFA